MVYVPISGSPSDPLEGLTFGSIFMDAERGSVWRTNMFGTGTIGLGHSSPSTEYALFGMGMLAMITGSPSGFFGAAPTFGRAGLFGNAGGIASGGSSWATRYADQVLEQALQSVGSGVPFGAGGSGFKGVAAYTAPMIDTGTQASAPADPGAGGKGAAGKGAKGAKAEKVKREPPVQAVPDGIQKFVADLKTDKRLIVTQKVVRDGENKEYVEVDVKFKPKTKMSDDDIKALHTKLHGGLKANEKLILSIADQRFSDSDVDGVKPPRDFWVSDVKKELVKDTAAKPDSEGDVKIGGDKKFAKRTDFTVNTGKQHYYVDASREDGARAIGRLAGSSKVEEGWIFVAYKDKEGHEHQRWFECGTEEGQRGVRVLSDPVLDGLKKDGAKIHSASVAHLHHKDLSSKGHKGTGRFPPPSYDDLKALAENDHKYSGSFPIDTMVITPEGHYDISIPGWKVDGPLIAKFGDKGPKGEEAYNAKWAAVLDKGPATDVVEDTGVKCHFEYFEGKAPPGETLSGGGAVGKGDGGGGKAPKIAGPAEDPTLKRLREKSEADERDAKAAEAGHADNAETLRRIADSSKSAYEDAKAKAPKK